MPFYRLKDGTQYHVKVANKAKWPAPCAARRNDGTQCAVISRFLCDWKVGPRMTCDQPLCEDHAQEVAPDKHLCPTHQASWVEWRRAQLRPL